MSLIKLMLMLELPFLYVEYLEVTDLKILKLKFKRKYIFVSEKNKKCE